MARVYPFRALRYNLAHVSAQDVVTQAWDEITPAMQQACYQRSPYNLARVTLRLPELFDDDSDPCASAARELAAWRSAGILAQERQPCIFAWAQRYTLPGQPSVTAERRGFLAVGEVCDYSQRVILPHEQSVSRSRTDRLQLLRATRTHFDPILMLYSDPGRTVGDLLFGSDAGSLPEIELTDEAGVLHRVWKISDPARVNLVTTALEDKKLIIADGHNRYDAALSYARECAATATEACFPGRAPRPEATALMAFVNMDAGPLVILPSHRVITGLSGFSTARFLESAAPYFDVEELSLRDTAVATGLLAHRGQGTAFIAMTSRGWYRLAARPAAVAEALSPVSPRLRQLDIVQLHTLVLDRLLGAAEPQIRSLRDAAEAADQVARGEADLAFLVNPVTLDQLREVAFAGERMPHQSTDFYPRLLSGLAIYALD